MTLLPNRKQCLALLEEHSVPENIVRHSLAVEKVAVFLVQKLKEAGEKVDIGLVSRAAILHDIGKAEGLKKNVDHVSLSKKMVFEAGFPSIAEVVGKHALFQPFEEKPFSSLEEKIVFYADKRVKHDKIVSLEERFKYLLERYGTSEERLKKIYSVKPLVEKIEEEIFSKISASRELEELK